MKLLNTYYVWTMGCQMNEADSRRLSGDLEAFGLTPALDSETADVIVLNTCVVRQQAENKIYGRIGRLKPLKLKAPHKIYAVMGCFVGGDDPQNLKKKYPFIDLFMPPSDTNQLMDLLTARRDEITTRQAQESIMNAPYSLPKELCGKVVSANVSVILGCSHRCSYCIIPLRRGNEVSRNPKEILQEVRSLVKQGVKEVVLLGQIVDRYGLDLEFDYDLSDLLTEINEVEELVRIRLLTSHPSYMTDKLLDAIATLPKVCPHIEIPIQAGSNAILKAMRRGYTVEEYRDLVKKIRIKIPDAAVHCDIIVGFCGETDEDFSQTYDLLKEMRFAKVHIAKYSPRPGTKSADSMSDNVSPEEKESRRKKLDDLQFSIQEEAYAKFDNQNVEVLVESKQKGRWRGRTVENRLVFFESDDNLIGKLVKINITHCGAYSLVGRLIEIITPITTN